MNNPDDPKDLLDTILFMAECCMQATISLIKFVLLMAMMFVVALCVVEYPEEIRSAVVNAKSYVAPYWDLFTAWISNAMAVVSPEFLNTS